jgi:3-methyladenine DNA glycosylase AlkD
VRPGPSIDATEVIAHLHSLRNSRNIAGQSRFGITPATERLGIPIPVLRGIARDHRRNHGLALALWASGVHEARILASYVDDPARVSARQMDAWARDFDTWDVCDQVCGNLFRPHAPRRGQGGLLELEEGPVRQEGGLLHDGLPGRPPARPA